MRLQKWRIDKQLNNELVKIIYNQKESWNNTQDIPKRKLE